MSAKMSYRILALLVALEVLAPSEARSIFETRATNVVLVSSNLPLNWTYTGCYSDDSKTPTLSGAMYTNQTAMTQESCIDFCWKRGFLNAGVKNSTECFCGNDNLSTTVTGTVSDCALPCSGNSTLACGGSTKLTLFTSNQTAPIPIDNPGFGLWNMYGCYQEGTNSPVLANIATVAGGLHNMTVTNCISSCQTSGFVLAGVEASGLCYCDNQVSTGSTPLSDSTACSKPCNGNATEICGSTGYLNLYGFNNTANPLLTASSSTSTTSTSTTSRSFSSSIVPSSSSSSTSITPTSSSSSSTTTLAPVAATPATGDQSSSSSSTLSTPSTVSILATSSPSSSSTTSSPIPSSQTSTSSMSSPSTSSSISSSVSSTSSSVSSIMSTTSVPAQIAVAASSGGSSSTITTSSSTTSSTSAAPTSEWYSVGCYTDAVGSRTLRYQQYGNANIMTREQCQYECKSAGYTVSGVEYYSECYCDTQIGTNGAYATDQTSCNTPCNGNSNEFCGGGNRLNVFIYGIPGTSTSTSSSSLSVSATSSSASSTSTAVASGWSYLGCYTDAVGSRTLANGQNGNNDIMTVELCQATCKTAGYTLSGVEYAGECYCDNVLRNGGGPAPDGETYCNMACHGNSSEICGGGNRLSLYSYGSAGSSSSSSSITVSKTSTTSTSSASAIPTSSWTSLGCYNDSVGARTLSNPMYGSNDIMTVELCQNFCKKAGYTLSGVEYGGECYCDNTFMNYGAPASDGCTIACHGSATEICGGGNRLNVYQYVVLATSSSSSLLSTTSSSSSLSSLPTSSSSGSSMSSTTSITSSSSSFVSSTTSTSASAAASATKAIGWYYAGCYTDAVGSRTLSNGLQVAGGGNNMSIESCTTVCQASKYTIAGMEYSGECYCDNSYKNGGGLAPDGETYCNMACNGNKTEICGGSNRLSVYTYYSGVPASTTTSTTGSSSSSTFAAATSSTSSSAVALPTGWAYNGCYIDGDQGRVMGFQQPDDAKMTVESCVSICNGKGYTVAGMEYGVQCFCDNYIRNGGKLTRPEGNCNMACGGNSAEICGAGNRLSVYNIGNLTIYQPPKVTNTSLPGNWTYQGCLTDNADARTFPYRITNMVNNNTATNCLSLCSEYGYPAGGMEFASECYCGDFSNVVNAGATIVGDEQCTMSCSGDPQAICGDGGRISYYAWTGADLYDWNKPTGNAAGQYQFLIGGVVIPLVTSQTIKGKVTFLEKFGTGAPNTTGAYELDLSEINNFQAAWRPMHVKTDIFCSASLVLPDKAGRQINVGGWANDATYGIRLYTPDGSPGVAGANDWQENVNEVSLQNGRWYPTAMIMANGSILVVGGEEGSNGAPVPTLELLPKSGGVLYCDWLDRTDPYNLYPFLAVLPSGGIFVAYYNEARILDPTSLQTSRVLPNMPGAVNDFDGGRTYPFEGTSVLLPQHAPYSDPLQVMVCGGSTPGPEIALDNCVSISPDVAGANWTIERMPSARVISCMTALPDGTFLILNGGQQGRAGFGLAINPNHNAVLYDPSRPVNHRMSVMANTTIDRLYHSEAILLQDGRVLVSGSDPEDERFVQEYRVEVFVPPYLLTGAAVPSITVPKTDWGYGGSYSVTLNSGNSGNIKFSLLGAESSTHGNSMGQRTIFPAFNCSGNICSITAPPGPNICPPGWFQLFVLDGGVPGRSVYVRIGGDPAGLGNWPNYSDFMPLPGV